MVDSTPPELEQAESLIHNAKFEEALELLSGFEKGEEKNSLNFLSSSILKGRVYCYNGKYKEAVELGETTYQLSQLLGCISETIYSLLSKAYILYFGKVEEAFENISEAENLFSSINNTSSRINADILLVKSMIFHHMGDLSKAFELASKCLSFHEKSNERLDLANIYCHLGELNLYKSDNKLGIEYAMKSLEIHKELDNQVGISKCLHLIGSGYYNNGEFNRAIKIGKQALSIKEIDIITKLESFDLLADSYKSKGELDLALDYQTKAGELAEKEGYTEEWISCIYGIGAIYRRKGELDKAIDYFKNSLALSEKFESSYGKRVSYYYLIVTSLDINSLDHARIYLRQLENLTNKLESSVFNNVYLIAKALVLKKGGRIRHRTEAELILKKISEKEIESPMLYILASVNLCEIFLEELSVTNNEEVLDELNPLINRLLIYAEKEYAFPWLVEGKLLQAKLALIQLEFNKAQQVLTQAQKIAEIHELNLLASKISNEHDNLLEQLNDWINLQKIDAPMSDRIKLSSINEVVNRMQGKSAIGKINAIHEEPVLLLIMGEGGFLLFSTQFGNERKLEEELVSGFITAFNNFSSELFSKGLDRAKSGEYMMLIETAAPFLLCYLFKGQTYLAKQKLSKFAVDIKKIANIWQTLKKCYESNQTIDLKNLPSLELLIKEIFVVV
ncbi:MAG: tetratricopeptide repeat protein [Candidatus Thorarchaeota archaeon]